jgi:chromosome segregation ATPase
MLETLAALSVTGQITWAICSFIVLIVIISILFRHTAHRRAKPAGPVISLAPGAVISLGIFGTFLGIYLGLRNFDTTNINDSIPQLLEGLKTAFITSLFGMFFSLFLKYIYGIYERRDLQKDSIATDDPISILRQIANGVVSLSTTVDSIGETIVKCFKSDEEYSIVSQLKLIRTEMNDLKREVTKSLNEFSEKVAELGTEAMIEALRNVIQQFNAQLNDLVGEEFKQLKEVMIKLVEWQENHRTAVDEMQRKLSDYLDHVRVATELLDKAATSMHHASDHLDSIDGSVSAISVSVEDIEQHITNLKAQNEQLKEFIDSIRTIGEEAKGVLPSLTKHIGSSTSELVRASQLAKDQLQEAGESLGSTVKGISEEMNKSANLHSQQVEKSIEQIQKNLEEVLNVSLTALGEQLASLSNKFAEDYTPLTDHLREVVRIAERINNARSH